jgi:hypothetical protein
VAVWKGRLSLKFLIAEASTERGDTPLQLFGGFGVFFVQ